MKINVLAGKIEKHATDAAVIPLFENEKPGKVAERVDKALWRHDLAPYQEG